MYAIETYFIGPTNYRGSRIAARVMERGSGWGAPMRKLILDWDHRWEPERNHRAAAEALAVKLGWFGRWIEAGGDNGASLWVNSDRCAVGFTAAPVEAA